MADKSAELLTRDDKIAQAKEFYARGYRNYVVGDFNEAAEDLSRSCELYAELFGDESEEVAVPNLFYGKTLIELAQGGENKVLAISEEEEEDDDGVSPAANNQVEDDDDDDDDDESDNEAEAKIENGNGEKAAASDANAEAGGSAVASSSSTSEPQPGTSSGIQNGNGAAVSSEEEEANENLQYAWEALEMAAKIFRRLGDSHEEYLAEAHYGLGEILMENQNCAEALQDYTIAYDIYSKTGKVGERRLAEIKYKLGLCNYSTMKYDKAISDLQQSADYIKKSIEAQKEFGQSAEVEKTVDDLNKMHDDILNKITDVQDSKRELMSSLLSKGGLYSSLLGGEGGSSLLAGASTGAGAGSSSSSSSAAAVAEKPKVNDISHLIKRKKPDSSATETPDAEEIPSPAKKTAA